MDTRMLMCMKCTAMTTHEFVRIGKVDYSFTGYDMTTYSGRGLKELWKCQKCQTERTYGSVDVRDSTWTLLHEKDFLQNVLRHFWHSKTNHCKTEREFLEMYLQAVDQRYYGFDGKKLGHYDRQRIKEIAINLMSGYSGSK